MALKGKIKGLFGEGFIYWWIISLVLVFMFDIFWMLQTTFRPMSYFAFYPVLLLSAFFLALPSLFFRRGVVQTVWLLFFSFLFIANLMYCLTYYNAIPLHSYGLVGNLRDFQSSVADSFRWYFIFLPLLPILAFAIYRLNFLPRYRKQLYFYGKTLKTPIFPYLACVIILVFIVWIGDAWRGGIMKRMDFMANYAYLSSSITPIYSLAGYLIHDYHKTMEKLTPKDEKEVEEWIDLQEKMASSYWADSIRLERKRPQNLVLILCESLESWVLQKDVEGKELTPFLNSLIKDTTTFYAPKVVTQVGSGRSIDAQLLILAGMQPMNNRAYAYDAIENEFFTLPKAMKAEGASTILFTCDKPYVWNQAMVNQAFGVDSLVWAKDFDIDETAGPSRRLSDGSFMRQIAEKLRNDQIWKAEDKIMLVAVTYSGHNPFNLPEHLRLLELKGDYPEIIKNYMVTANYTDHSLSFLIDYLKSRDDWKETMVVITGDHEGLASDRKTALLNPSTRNIVDSLQHTPLIILNSPVAGRYEDPMGQADIYTTILDLMGLGNYEWKGLGRSVFDPGKPPVALGSQGNVEGDIASVDSITLSHIENSRHISDLILKFNLLQKEER